MEKTVSNNSECLTLDKRSAYFDYKLHATQAYVYKLLIGVSIINLLLLIPDLAIIENSNAKICISILRPVYSLVLFILSYRIKVIKSYKSFFVINSVCELIAVAIFLFVFCQYSQPNFMIQSMGLVTLIIIFFLFPNRWINMLSIALAGSVGFFICASVLEKSMFFNEYLAAAAYVIIAIFLCGSSAISAEKHQYREFTSKTKLEHLSSTDFLTDTANRSKMIYEAEGWMTLCRQQKQPLSLIFIDVDDLKLINDVYGHTAGDSVLSDLAKLIRCQLHSLDILARWGGDEFVVLLPNVSLDEAISFSESVETDIRKTAFCQQIRVTCSFGIVEMHEDSTFDTMICQADKLMYDGKLHGKDNVCYSR